MDFDVKRYADLARVRLTKEEQDKYQKDLEEVLSHVDKLKQVDVKGVEPMTGGTALKNVFREDVAEPFTEGGLGFPDEKDGYLKVPKVIDTDAE